jgi:hypothetical protein
VRRSAGVGAVDLVAGDPRGRDTSHKRAADHRSRERGLGRKRCLIWDSGRGAAVRVLRPRARQVQSTVDQGVPAASGVGEEHRDLSVLDPPRGAGVLALHPDRVHTFLQITGLINHEHRVRVGECVRHVIAQIVADSIGVPLRP